MAIELQAPDATSCNACPSRDAAVMVSLGEVSSFTFRLCHRCAKELRRLLTARERRSA
jgi:hypothetical protein